MRRPRPVSAAVRERRDVVREQRVVAAALADREHAARRATRAAWLSLAAAAAGWSVAVAGAAWFASDPRVVDLPWLVGGGGRFGAAGVLAQVTVSRGDLVSFAAAVTALPVVLGVLGLVRTARPAGLRRATAPSLWSWAAVVGAVALVPNVLGCYAVGYASGGYHDLLLVPAAWPPLASAGCLFLGAAAAERRRRRR